ncbi:MAG: hypothetical protein M1815_001422 [Lichina confinis]|nr:MAG: hypothetical protein M1815_001422 [Lichina confinis]
MSESGGADLMRDISMTGSARTVAAAATAADGGINGQAIDCFGSESSAPQSKIGQFFTFAAFGIFFSTVGFVVAKRLMAKGMLNGASDAQTLANFKPANDDVARVDDYIKNHPLAQSLRENPDFTESRPHLKFPEVVQRNNLTTGVLLGPGKIVVPPLTWNEKGGKTLVSIFYLGDDVCGHPGVVHGGLLATILDEGLAFCCFPALPNKIGMTANLNINYRKPAPAGEYFVLRAKTVKVEGRKAWVEGHIETLEGHGKEPVICAEASALYIEPKQAAWAAMLTPPLR